MDGLFILAFLFMFTSSIITVIKETNKKKKQRDFLNKKLDEIYNRTMGNANKTKDTEKQKRGNVEKIGNLEKHYDEAIRDDYKKKADDYFSEKSRKLDEYLSRDINDRLREYKDKKAVLMYEENEDKSNADDSAFYDEIDDDKIQFLRTNITKSIVIKEILDKPLALRRIND